jgi:hypothetical protein
MTCQQPSAGFRGFKLECDATRWARGIRCDEPLRADSSRTETASGRTGVRAKAAMSGWRHVVKGRSEGTVNVAAELSGPGAVVLALLKVAGRA